MSKTIFLALVVLGLVALGFFGWQHQQQKQLPIQGRWSSGCVVDGDNSKSFTMEFGKDTYRSNAQLFNNTQCEGPSVSEYHGSAYAELTDGALPTCNGDKALLLTLYWDDKTQPKPLVVQLDSQQQLRTGYPNDKAKESGIAWCLDQSTVYQPQRP